MTMNTYEYECKKCDAIIEVTHSIKQNPRIFCSECGSRMKRLMSGGAAGFVKGSKTPCNWRKK